MFVCYHYFVHLFLGKKRNIVLVKPSFLLLLLLLSSSSSSSSFFFFFFFFFPVGWGCRIHRILLLCRGLRPPLQRVSWYDTKWSDGEVPGMLELWGMQSTPSLPLLPGPLWPRVGGPGMILSIGQIELNCVLIETELFEIDLFLTFKLCTYAKLNCLKYHCFIGLMRTVFASGPRDRCSISGRVIPKTQKWYLMPPCLTLSIIR